jgi:peptidyl-prolyl cis-trans isomerase C
MARWLAAGLLVAMTACGGDEEVAPDRRPAAAISLVADPAGRTVVAEVDGRPIYHDCVAEQAAARGLDVRAALDDCIAFELLAQEAERRGHAADPEVARAGKNEMVRALIDADFKPTLDEPTDIPAADIQWLWDTQLKSSYNKPERRRATYCRVGVKKKTPRGGARDLKAKAIAEQIHRAMADLRFTPELLAMTCHLASGGRKVRTTTQMTEPFSDTGAWGQGYYAREFAQAAFSVGEVGRVSTPTRTEWGWDIVLLTEIRPPETRTFAEAEPEIREMLLHHPSTAEYRVKKFLTWLERYARAARISVDPTAVPGDGLEAVD